MKVLLFDIENQLPKAMIDEAHDLMRELREYDIQSSDPGKFHCISRQPDFHVEITLKDDGTARAKCHCTVFRRTNKCKHAVASLLLLREFLKKDRKTHKKAKQQVLEEVIRKVKPSDFKAFITSYAMSHSLLRAEILSNYLYLTKKPDYYQLLNDLAPIDKYGQIKLNRNNLKSVRAVSTTLLKRAQLLLKNQSPAEALQILEAVLLHLHKLLSKLPMFHEQLMVEVKLAYRLFEQLCLLPMAPRIQQQATTLAMDICERESYQFPSGMKPLIYITEDFFLEEKTRKEAFSIAERKALTGITQRINWIALLVHWTRIWNVKYPITKIKALTENTLHDVIKEFANQNDHEDLLYAFDLLDKKKYSESILHGLLQTGLRSAKALGDQERIVKFTSELALHYQDADAWSLLFETDKETAEKVLDIIESIFAPSSDAHADNFLISGYNTAGNIKSLVNRVRKTGNIELLMQYDYFLKDKFRNEVIDMFAEHIIAIREQYGGVIARQKLNNIFSHLKTGGLHTEVIEKIKLMDKNKKDTGEIRGFVFDLDGVIVDTAVHHYQSWKKILRELGAEITEEDDHHTRGAGRMESLEYLLNRYNISLSEGEKQYWASRKNDAYLEAIFSITPSDLLPGALAFLDESKKLGLAIGLGSASKNAGTVLEKLGIADKFDAIIDGNHITASKPDPEIFEKACNALGLPPSAVVVFEDAGKGIQAALAAGCKAVGIGDESTLTGAHLVIPGLNYLTPTQILRQLA